MEKERRAVERQIPADKWSDKAIESRDFNAYQLAIMHDWLRTLTLMAACLVPLFFILDMIMMPSTLLPRFAIYRSISTAIAAIQVLIVRKTRPGKISYIHGYIVSLQVGGIISLMTVDLGGFNSSYYAGLNLVIIGVNLLTPWQAYHTVANSLLILLMYVSFNLIADQPYDPAILVNNLFFLGATAILSASINFVRFMLIKKEFALLVDLGKTRDALVDEKDIVEERTRSLQSLLDVSGQGFLSFNPDFVIGHEYSMECEKIFRQDIHGSRIDELLYSDPGERADFRSGMELFFSGKSKPDVIFDLMDKVIKVGDLIITIDFRAVHEGLVMLALTDITEERKLQEKSRKENEKWNMLLKVISNRHAFVSFNHEAKELFETLANNKEKPHAFIRDVHTFKSSAGFLGFNKTQRSAHEFENFVSDRMTLGQEFRSDEQIAYLTGSFAEELAVVTNSLGKEWRLDTESIEIPLSEYLMIEDQIKIYSPDNPIIDTLEEHRKKPLSDLMNRFPQMAEDLASRMGKRIMPVNITGGEVSVIPENYDELINSFGHLIRNIVDHGIELPVERKAKGKPEAGLIEIDIVQKPEKTIFTFLDDGMGIPISKVERKARDLGLVREGETVAISRLLTFIFNENFSTNVTVSEISGRGVGLPAVREAVRKMGGKVKIKTTRDKGTVFIIEIPQN